MHVLRYAPWFSRFLILATALLLSLLGRKFILDPIGAAAASHMSLDAPLAVTNMRSSFGAFPLGTALALALCLVLPDQRRSGLVLGALIIGTVLAVRLLGIALDGTLRESLFVIGTETALLALNLLALAGERACRRRSEPTAATPDIASPAPARG